MSTRSVPSRLAAIAAVFLSLAGIAGTVALKEASSKLAADELAPVFGRIQKLIDSGFGESERDVVVSSIAGLKPDDEFSREFSVKFGGHEIPLKIHAVMAPRELAVVDFASTPDLTDAIRREVNSFLDARDGHR